VFILTQHEECDHVCHQSTLTNDDEQETLLNSRWIRESSNRTEGNRQTLKDTQRSVDLSRTSVLVKPNVTVDDGGLFGIR
jgi:hypothetical protein